MKEKETKDLTGYFYCPFEVDNKCPDNCCKSEPVSPGILDCVNYRYRSKRELETFSKKKKIYVYRVLYKGKIIDEVQVKSKVVDKDEITDNAYAQTLDKLEIVFVPSKDN